MAISEKMRGQISGLKRAAMNAQDGISYLQTAEGAMDQTTSILQRMRELAVQAANGIYTTNDRAEIQKEIEQLKAEVDRVSTSTEFNTRKLINGAGTALWSADTSNLKAIIRGPVAEGNYEIQMSVKPGKNQIFKTDIMTLNEGAIGAEIFTAGGTPNSTNIGSISDPVTMPSTGDDPFTVVVKNSAATTASTAVTTIAGTVSGGNSLTLDYNFTVTSAATPALRLTAGVSLTLGDDMKVKTAITVSTAQTLTAALTYIQDNGARVHYAVGDTVTAGTIIPVGATILKGSTLPPTTVFAQNTVIPAGSTFSTSGASKGVLSAGVTMNQGTILPDADLSGSYQDETSAWSVTSVYATTATGTMNTHSGYMEIEFLESTSSTSSAQYRMRFIDATNGRMGAWQTVTSGSTNGFSAHYEQPGYEMSFDVNITIGNDGQITKGDKLLVSVSKYVSAGSTTTGGGSITLSDGPNGMKGPTIYYSAGLTPKDNGDEEMDLNSVKVYAVDLDPKTGNINVGNVTLNFKEQLSGQTQEGDLEFAIQGGGEAATTSTKLRDIARFVDADGNNVFDQKQELTIFGNGTSTVVHIEGNDTITTMVEKLNKAIVEELGMGSDDPQVNANLVRYISVPDEQGWGTLKGTFIIQSALTGDMGRLSFVGDQALIDAFSMAEVQTAVNGESTVTVRDAHTGAMVGTEVTGDDRVYTIIDGVELVIDSRAGAKSKWDPATNSIIFESNKDLEDDSMFIHIVDNRTSLQIGANKGQDLDVSIPQLDVMGLGLENTVLVTQELAREAIGQLDRAVQRVVSARATVGAQVSRLEYTVQNLNSARENLTTSESRIRDLDVAEESTNFAKNQILVQSGVAMLAQANQLPQMALQLIQG
jgi:flagellin